VGIKRKPDSSAKTMWAPSRAAFFYTKPIPALPAIDLLFVALQGATLRLLIAPAQLPEKPSHVIAVVADAELASNQLHHPIAGPQIGAVSMGHGSLQEKSYEPLLLRHRKLRRTTRGRSYLIHGVALFLPPVTPSHDRARFSSKPARDLVQGKSGIHQCQCAPATIRKNLR